MMQNEWLWPDSGTDSMPRHNAQYDQHEHTRGKRTFFIGIQESCSLGAFWLLCYWFLPH